MAVKEMYLTWSQRGLSALDGAAWSNDHRRFGHSGDEPCEEIDPFVQVADGRAAITHAQRLEGVDPGRVGVVVNRRREQDCGSTAVPVV